MHFNLFAKSEKKYFVWCVCVTILPMTLYERANGDWKFWTILSLSRFVAFIIYSNWYWYTREMCPLFNETFKLSTVSAHIIFTWSLQTQNTMSIIVVITHIEMTEFFFLLLYLNLVIFYSIELLFSCNVCLFSLSFASSIHILIRIFRISFIQSFDLTISWSEEKRSKLKWSEVIRLC